MLADSYFARLQCQASPNTREPICCRLGFSLTRSVELTAEPEIACWIEQHRLNSRSGVRCRSVRLDLGSTTRHNVCECVSNACRESISAVARPCQIVARLEFSNGIQTVIKSPILTMSQPSGLSLTYSRGVFLRNLGSPELGLLADPCMALGMALVNASSLFLLSTNRNQMIDRAKIDSSMSHRGSGVTCLTERICCQ
jgi:hypothetical protein